MVVCVRILKLQTARWLGRGMERIEFVRGMGRLNGWRHRKGQLCAASASKAPLAPAREPRVQLRLPAIPAAAPKPSGSSPPPKLSACEGILESLGWMRLRPVVSGS